MRLLATRYLTQIKIRGYELGGGEVDGMKVPRKAKK